VARVEDDTAYVARLAAALRDVGHVLIDEQLMKDVLDRNSWEGGRFETWAREFLHLAHPRMTAGALASWMQKPTGEGERPGGDPVFFLRMADVVLDTIALLRQTTHPDRPRAPNTSPYHPPAEPARPELPGRGLHLTPGGFCYDSRSYPLTGRPLAMLRALLGSRFRCLTRDQLREKMGLDDTDVTYPDQVVRDAAGDLRTVLRRAATDAGRGG
jgi:hypothetical protein